MLELFTWKTPNGYKPLILLEELGLPYCLRAVDLSKDEQHLPEFTAINPNGKIPALVDIQEETGETCTVFESGAILIYLAEKAGAFLASSGPARYEAIQWLMFQMGGVGPILGQAAHFVLFAEEKHPYSIERYKKESARLLGVLNGHLARVNYLAGDYSIADMATYPWVLGVPEKLGFPLEDFPHVQRWVQTIRERPAVVRAYGTAF